MPVGSNRCPGCDQGPDQGHLVGCRYEPSVEPRRLRDDECAGCGALPSDLHGPNCPERHITSHPFPGPGLVGKKIDRIEFVMPTVDETLATRASKYGDFADVARISEKLLEAARSEGPFWDKLDDTKKEGVKLILHKIARAISGDPEYRDNWHDIAGYAKLVEDRCKP